MSKHTPYKYDGNNQALVFYTDDLGHEHEWPMPSAFVPAHMQSIPGFPEDVASLLQSTVVLDDASRGKVLTRKGLSPMFLVRLEDGQLREVHRGQIMHNEVRASLHSYI